MGDEIFGADWLLKVLRMIQVLNCLALVAPHLVVVGRGSDMVLKE